MSFAAPAGFERRQKASLRHEDIAGGKVRRGFRMGDKYIPPGTVLTSEQILSMPYANRCALIDRFIEVWPAEAQRPAVPPVHEGPTKVMMIHMGGGKFNVIEGWVMNEAPIERHEAEDLMKLLQGPAAPAGEEKSKE